MPTIVDSYSNQIVMKALMSEFDSIFFTFELGKEPFWMFQSKILI